MTYTGICPVQAHNVEGDMFVERPTWTYMFWCSSNTAGMVHRCYLPYLIIDKRCENVSQHMCWRQWCLGAANVMLLRLGCARNMETNLPLDN